MVTYALPLIGGLLSRLPSRRERAGGPALGVVLEVCPEEELDRRGRLVIRLPEHGLDVLVVRAGRRVFAVENRCPHLGRPLDDGEVRGRVIACAAHGRRFDLLSGHRRGARAGRGQSLATLRSWVADGRVWLAAPTGVGRPD